MTGETFVAENFKKLWAFANVLRAQDRITVGRLVNTTETKGYSEVIVSWRTPELEAGVRATAKKMGIDTAATARPKARKPIANRPPSGMSTTIAFATEQEVAAWPPAKRVSYYKGLARWYTQANADVRVVLAKLSKTDIRDKHMLDGLTSSLKAGEANLARIEKLVDKALADGRSAKGKSLSLSQQLDPETNPIMADALARAGLLKEQANTTKASMDSLELSVGTYVVKLAGNAAYTKNIITKNGGVVETYSGKEFTVRCTPEQYKAIVAALKATSSRGSSDSERPNFDKKTADRFKADKSFSLSLIEQDAIARRDATQHYA